MSNFSFDDDDEVEEKKVVRFADAADSDGDEDGEEEEEEEEDQIPSFAEWLGRRASSTRAYEVSRKSLSAVKNFAVWSLYKVARLALLSGTTAMVFGATLAYASEYDAKNQEAFENLHKQQMAMAGGPSGPHAGAGLDLPPAKHE